MPASLTISTATLYSFLIVLARVSGALVFTPLPGVRQGPQAVRIVLALSLTILLYPRWPEVPREMSLWALAGWLALDAALGVWFGLMAGFLAEAFGFMAQTVGLQAGFAYASMVDPQTQADSGILLILAQLAAGLLFFAFGLDHELLRAFARSLEVFPPGTWVPAEAAWRTLARLGAGMVTTGVRLALPVLALLALADIALALLGRVNAQLQLLTLSFPLKMLAAMAALAAFMPLFARVLGAYAAQITAGLRAAGHP